MKLINPEKKRFSRREFLSFFAKAGCAYILLETVGFLVSVEVAKHIEITHHVIETKGLTKKWDRTFILHFSDMHISQRGVDFINPDVVAQLASDVSGYLQSVGADSRKTFHIDTGDVVSKRTGSGIATPLEDVAESLHHLRKIPAAHRFAVEGNHDVSHPQSEKIAQMLEDAGFNLLGKPEQSNFILDSELLPFTLLGLPDFTSRRNWYSSQAAKKIIPELEQFRSTKPLLVPTHTSISDSWQGGVLGNTAQNALFLHGHTHGGQMGPNTPMQALGTYYALHRFEYASQFYRGLKQFGSNMVSVSSGVGHSAEHKVRTARPEVIIYELRSAPAA